MNPAALKQFSEAAKNKKKIRFQNFDYEYNPFNCYNVIGSDDIQVIELFVSAKWFASNPRKWTDMSQTYAPFRKAMLTLVELFNYVAQKLGGFVASGPAGSLRPNCIATFERKVSRYGTHDQRDAGYSYRIISQRSGKEGDIPGIIEELLKENDAKKWCEQITINPKTQHKRKRDDGETSDCRSDAITVLQKLTSTEYKRICGMYLAKQTSDDRITATSLSDTSNPINPLVAFSIKTACRLACNSEADDLCSSHKEYENEKRLPHRLKFPHNDLVWRMRLEFLELGSSANVYFPFVNTSNGVHNNLRDAFIRNQTRYKQPKDDSEEARREALAKYDRDCMHAGFIYDQTMANSDAVDDIPNDVDTLKLKHAMDVQAALNEAKTPEQLDTMMDAIRHKSLSEFAILFSQDGDGPDAIKAIARFMDNYTAEHETLCLEVPKVTKNLTRFGDEMLMLLISLETLFKVNTQHRDILCLFFKQLHVYSLSAFNPHTLYSGPGQAGKSFALKLVMKWLIDKTWTNLANQSLKANLVPGHKQQCMLRFYEDVNPAMLGIQNGQSGHSKSGETANTEMEALIKAWLTNGRMNASVLDTSMGRMNAVTAEIESRVESVVSMCSNAPLKNVPHAMATRFDTVVYQNRDRLEGGGLQGKANYVSNPMQQTAEQVFITRMRRNQALTAIIFQMVYVGILPSIDMTVARVIFSKTLDLAKKAGMTGVEDIRNFERLEMICRVLVVWDAISIVWDSKDSPLRHYDEEQQRWHFKPHDIKHFLYVARYLRSTVDHATFAIGLLQNQFEDEITHSVLEELMRTRYAGLKSGFNGSDRLTADLDLNQTKEQESKRIKVIPKAKKINYKKGEKQSDQPALDAQPSSTSSTSSSSSSTAVTVVVAGSNTNGAFATTNPPTDGYGVVREDENYYICPFIDTNTGKSISSATNTDRVHALATDVHSSMVDKPLFDEVVRSLQNLLCAPVEKVILDKDGKQAKTKKLEHYNAKVPALDFRNGEMFLSIKAVKEQKHNALMECVKKVVNHKYASCAQYLYGVTRKHTPFMFEMITVDQDDSNKRQELQVIDPNHFDAALVKMTENYLSSSASIMASTTKKGQQQIERLSNFSLKAAFSDRHMIRIDCDLNEYAERNFLLKEKISHSLIEALPTGDPLARAIQLIDTREQETGQELVFYPNDFSHANPADHLNSQMDKIRTNPQFYSLKKQLDELEAEARESYTKERNALSQQQQQQQESEQEPVNGKDEVDHTNDHRHIYKRQQQQHYHHHHEEEEEEEGERETETHEGEEQGEEEGSDDDDDDDQTSTVREGVYDLDINAREEGQEAEAEEEKEGEVDDDDDDEQAWCDIAAKLEEEQQQQQVVKRRKHGNNSRIVEDDDISDDLINDSIQIEQDLHNGLDVDV